MIGTRRVRDALRLRGRADVRARLPHRAAFVSCAQPRRGAHAPTELDENAVTVVPHRPALLAATRGISFARMAGEVVIDTLSVGVIIAR
jgi:hypothetical protein